MQLYLPNISCPEYLHQLLTTLLPASAGEFSLFSKSVNFIKIFLQLLRLFLVAGQWNTKNLPAH